MAPQAPHVHLYRRYIFYHVRVEQLSICPLPFPVFLWSKLQGTEYYGVLLHIFMETRTILDIIRWPFFFFFAFVVHASISYTGGSFFLVPGENGSKYPVLGQYTNT